MYTYMITILSEIISLFFRHFDPFFEKGYDIPDTHSGSDSEDHSDLTTTPVLEIPLSLILDVCSNDTGQLATSSQQIMDLVDHCTPQPAVTVLSTVEALDFNQIITSPCCSVLCLCKFNVSQIQACCI
jgi:hypothetical protein